MERNKMTRQVQLIMVTENNNNKFYNMIEEGSQIRIEYGRVGAAVRTCYKPLSKWDSIYREKTGKGYKDITSLKSEVKIQCYKEIEDSSVKYIVDLLISRAKQQIANNYRVSYTEVSQKQIEEAQAIVDRLAVISSSTAIHTWTDQFNNLLLQLYTVIPRRMAHVQDYLMKDKYIVYDDYKKKIAEEQELLDTMATQVKQNKILNEGDSDKTVLEASNLIIKPVINEDILEHIRYKLGNNVNQFSKAWGVTNITTKIDLTLIEIV